MYDKTNTSIDYCEQVARLTIVHVSQRNRLERHMIFVHTHTCSHAHKQPLAAHCYETGAEIPPLITACVSFIERDGLGLELEGLYRVSGAVAAQTEIRTEVIKAYSYVFSCGR